MRCTHIRQTFLACGSEKVYDIIVKRKHLFVYGTLMLKPILDRVVVGEYVSIPATLSAYARYRVKDQVYPALMPGNESNLVTGKLVLHVQAADLTKLDLFEGDMYHRIDVEVSVAGRMMKAQTYACKPTYEHLVSKQKWELSSFDRTAQQAFVREFGGWDHADH